LLETYRKALEARDVKTLVELGVVAPENAAELENVFRSYTDFHVALEDIVIGNGEQVSFSRINTTKGKMLRLPSPLTFAVTRRQDGQLALRAQD
jgi:hypothetical protein